MSSYSYASGWVPQSNFSSDTLSSRLWLTKTSGDSPHVTLEVFSAPKGQANLTFDQAMRSPFSPASLGQSFGPSWTTHWFRLSLTVPSHWSQIDCPLWLGWDSGSEAMVWTEDGEPQQGLTDHRNEYQISTPSSWAPGQAFTLYIEMAANGMFGLSDGIKPPDENRYFTLRECSIGLPNIPLRQIYYDLLALQDIAKALPPESAAGMDALYVANKALNTLDLDDPITWEAANSVTRSYLGSCQGVTGDEEGGTRHQVYAIGHCHIDTAWLWPFSETRRKTARSWSSQLKIMDRFPEHAFAASSAQQYEWLLEDYPGLFKRIQLAAGALDEDLKMDHAGKDADGGARGGARGGDPIRGVGRGFIPVGGSWVEMDANLPSGESIVRQFLYGQRFFKRHFKRTSEVFWLPDTFGYCAQLPQIMSQAGFKYFLTQKLSWNNINTFPHNTFYWRALNGTSQVLTHFPPANTYCSQVTTEDVCNTIKGNRDKDRAGAGSMLLFGFGDGGGGPTIEMLERLRRIASSSSPSSSGSRSRFTGAPSSGSGFTGGGAQGSLPRVKITGPVPFFKALESSSTDLLSWQGELYFELHRGSYTSHAANKALNRRCELLLREVEILGALATLSGRTKGPSMVQYKFPKDLIDQIWKDVLLFQFHDVIPGSAIAVVFETSLNRYLEMIPLLHNMRGEALRALALTLTPGSHESPWEGISPEEGGLSLEEIIGACPLPFIPPPPNIPPLPSSPSPTLSPPTRHPPIPKTTVNQKASLFAFNSLSFPVTQLVEADPSLLPQGYGEEGMQYNRANGGTVLFLAEEVPPFALVDLTGPSVDPLGQMQPTAGGVEGGKSVRGSVDVTTTLSPSEGQITSFTLSNDHLAVTLDPYGRILSLVDKAAGERELIPLLVGGSDGTSSVPMVGNRFVVHEDIPTFWDAWDIETSHLEKCLGIDGYSLDPTGGRIVDKGPLRASVAFTLPISPSSTLQLIVSLSCVDKRVDFELIVDWDESRRALKVEFPLALISDHATYETQFGAVERPTHQNTSWDWAKFEVVAHKWADLSEPDYGIALLNDSKYGHAARSLPPPPHGHRPGSPCSIMTLTLLRSPKCPDPTTDIGRHTIKYALLPHEGRWQEGGVVQAAHAFNQPLTLLSLPTPLHPNRSTLEASSSSSSSGHSKRGVISNRGLGSIFQVVHASKAKASKPLSRLSPRHRPPLLIDTIKLAEDPEEGSVVIIVRLYEPYGCRGRAWVTWDEAVVGEAKSVARCNLLEEEEEEEDMVLEGGLSKDDKPRARGVGLDYTPFTIYSLKIRF